MCFLFCMQIHRSIQLRVTAQALMQDIMRDTRCHMDHVDQLFHDVIDRTRKAMDAFHKEHATVCQQIQVSATVLLLIPIPSLSLTDGCLHVNQLQ